MGLCAVLGLWSAVRGMASAPSALRRATAIPALAVAPMPLPGAATPMPGRTVLGTARSLSPSTLPAAASTADAETPNVGTAIPTAVPLPTVAPALAAALQAALDAAVGGAIPGVVATVKVDGEVWHGASGLRDLAAQLPMEPGTLVRLGSVSKMYTAVVALQLVQEGKLALDAPVATWLPALPVPNADLITVRQVLGQTTGLYDYLEDRNFAEQAYDEPGRRWQPAELVEYAGRSEALFLPGAPGAWDYSSTNYVILGMLVERVSGMTLDQAIHRRIIDPLALTQTFFQPDDALQGELARGYADSTDRTDAAMSFVWATGSIVASTADLQRFGTALWAGALLDEATQVEMLAVVDGYGAYNMFELAYGLGIMRNRLSVGPDATGAERSLETREVWGHIGGFAGFRAAVWHAPQGNITIALGMNQASADPNDLATALFEAVLAYQGR